jgi:hypothetical protein
MTVTTKWNILGAKKRIEAVNGHDDVIFSVDYNITASDPENTSPNAPVGIFGRQTVLLSPPPVGASGFIPAESVTNAVLVGWIKAKLGEQQVASQEEVAQQKYAALATPETEDFTPAA